MDALLLLVGTCFVVALLRGLFIANRDPEYIFVPVPIQPRRRRSSGCLLTVSLLLLSLLLLALLGGIVVAR